MTQEETKDQIIPEVNQAIEEWFVNVWEPDYKSQEVKKEDELPF